MHNNINVAVGSPNVDYPRVYKTKFLKPGIPFALQVTDEDTKYIIKHNYDLGGESVTIPENCILEFEGGSVYGVKSLELHSNNIIRNGKITFVDEAEGCISCIACSNVLIENCVVNKKTTTEPVMQDGGWYCISVGYCSAVTIRNCVLNIDGTCFGMYMALSNYVKVEDCCIIGLNIDIANGNNGIVINGCNNIGISGNHIKNTSIGLFIIPINGDNHKLFINGNTIEECPTYGICSYHPNDNYECYDITITNNHIHHCYGHSDNSFGSGIYILDARKFNVTNNLIHDICIETGVLSLCPAGIGLNESRDSIVANNIIYNSGQAGIIADGENNKISCNQIYGIKQMGGIVIRKDKSGIVVSGNTVDLEEDGVPAFWFDAPNSITESTITGNMFKTIAGYSMKGKCSKSVISGNICIGKDFAYTVESKDCIIIGNYFESDGNTPSIYEEQNHSLITGNFINQKGSGPHLRHYEIAGGTIHEGNFFDNQHLYDILPVNYNKNGITSDRPSNPSIGVIFFDTTLGKPIWYDGSNWVDATGTEV